MASNWFEFRGGPGCHLEPIAEPAWSSAIPPRVDWGAGAAAAGLSHMDTVGNEHSSFTCEIHKCPDRALPGEAGADGPRWVFVLGDGSSCYFVRVAGFPAYLDFLGLLAGVLLVGQLQNLEWMARTPRDTPPPRRRRMRAERAGARILGRDPAPAGTVPAGIARRGGWKASMDRAWHAARRNDPAEFGAALLDLLEFDLFALAPDAAKALAGARGRPVAERN